MKILVLGAAGAMAAVSIRDLLDTVPDVQITAADTRPAPSTDPRISPVIVDVRDLDNTMHIIRGHDAVLNCVNYYFNTAVMQAALQARVPYTDLGGLYHGSRRQFALHEAFREAGVTAVLGMGSTPGITNVMAAALASRMDRVLELHVRVGCQDESASGPLPVPYALDTVLDEFAMEPMVFTEGQATAVAPMSGQETIEFPPPVGKMQAIYTLHSEVAMFPRSFPDLREASFKVAFPAEFTEKVRFLVQLGFASRDKLVGDISPRQMLLAVVGKQQAPADSEPRDCDVLRVHARGEKNGRSVSAMAECIVMPDKQRGIAAGSLDTGVPLSIVGQMLARGEIRERGVLCPETCVPQKQFFEELTKRGMHARIEQDHRETEPPN
jgi:saccharopine dehydrogenase-like NADP-dependent oxidoreductase